MGIFAKFLDRLSIEAQEAISVDQLSRMIFKAAQKTPDRHGAKGYADAWFCMTGNYGPAHRAPIAEGFEEKFEDAWGRLLDRGLLRWYGGSILSESSYHLTERGRTSKYGEGVIDEPEPTIADLEAAIGTSLDPVIHQYLEESISCFRDDHRIASQFCLGAVAERAMHLLREWLLAAGSDPKLSNATKMWDIINRCTEGLRQIRKAHQGLEVIPDLLDCIEGVAHVYRRSRNEVGHPTEMRQVNEDELAVLITGMRRQYLPALYRVLQLNLSEGS